MDMFGSWYDGNTACEILACRSCELNEYSRRRPATSRKRTAMRTVKLVVIGAAGVGKTSLRGQVSALVTQPLAFSSSVICSMYQVVSQPATERLSAQTSSRNHFLTPRTRAKSFVFKYGFVSPPICHFHFFTHTIGYCWPRTLFLPLISVLPWCRCSATHVRRQHAPNPPCADEMVVRIQTASSS